MFSMAPSCKGVFTTRPRWKRWVNTTSTSGSGWTLGSGAASWDRVNTLSSFVSFYFCLLFQLSLYSMDGIKCVEHSVCNFQTRSSLSWVIRAWVNDSVWRNVYFPLIICLSYLTRMPCDNRSSFSFNSKETRWFRLYIIQRRISRIRNTSKRTI